MKRETRTLLVWFLGSIIAVGVVIAVIDLAGSSSGLANVDHPSSFRIGPDTARVKVVEFSDYQCPACKSIAPHVKTMIATYGDRIQFVYRHYPLPQHKNALRASVAAEGAGAQGKFWRMHDRLFEMQEAWASLADPTEYFLLLGREALVEVDPLREAIKKQAAFAKIQGDIADGNRVGIQGTPTFFVNGRRLEMRQPKDLDDAITRELAGGS